MQLARPVSDHIFLALGMIFGAALFAAGVSGMLGLHGDTDIRQESAALGILGGMTLVCVIGFGIRSDIRAASLALVFAVFMLAVMFATTQAPR